MTHVYARLRESAISDRRRPERTRAKRGACDCGNSRRPLLLAGLLIAATLAVYAQTWWFGYVLIDDPIEVSGNPRVQAGFTWQNVIWCFSSFFDGNWIPLTWLSLMLDTTVFGFRPGGYHFTNVLFHVVDTVLLFVVLARATGMQLRKRIRRRAFCAASAACRIGGLDHGTQGRAERVFRLAGPAGVCAVCQDGQPLGLRGSRRVLRGQFALEADLGDVALSLTPARLLAPGSLSAIRRHRTCSSPQTAHGQSPLSSRFSRLLRDRDFCSRKGTWNQDVRLASAHRAR